MMNTPDIQDIFADCIDRILSGETLESCLRRYPSVASQLRAMLETTLPIRQLNPPLAEVLEDQAWVWAQIRDRIPSGEDRGGEPSARRQFRLILLLAATVILFVGVAVFGSGLVENNDVVQVLSTATNTQPATNVPPTVDQTSTATLTMTSTETVTYTPGVTATQTPTLTATASATATFTQTATATLTATETSTRTPRPSRTPTRTASPAPTVQLGACGAFLTEAEVRQQVLAIYPNTTITRIEQDERYSGTLIWEVRTSHGVVLIIEAECGTILELNSSGSDSLDSGSGDNSGNSSDNSGSDDSGDDSSDDHDNSGHGGGGSDD